MQHHRERDREADRRPQPALLGERRGPGGVGHVVDRADPAHPEERDDPPLPVVEPGLRPDLGAVPQEREPARHRPDDEHQGQAHQNAPPVEVGQQPVGQGEAQTEQDDEGQQRLQPVDDVVHVPVIVVVALHRPHGQRTREHGEEPVATDQLRGAVGHEQRREREQRLPHLCQPEGPGRRPEREPRQPPADGHPDEHPHDDLADELPRDPAQAPLRHRAHAREEDRRVDERERQAVVEPGLAGQREAHLVVLVDLLGLTLEGRPLHLHVRGEHRVRGRERGPEQQGGRCGDPERPPRQQGDGADRQRHRDAEQPPGRRPGPPRVAAAPAQRAVERQPDAHQRDEHGDLGDVLDDRPGRDRVELDVGQRRQQPDRHAGGHEHDRRGQGPPVQQLGQDGGQEQ